MEHSDKSMAYAYSKEFNLSRKELNIANEALNESAASSISAKEKVFTIDPKSVPIEQKSSIILLRNDLEASETMHSELRQMMSGMYPYMDGYVCLSNGIEYGDAEEWGKAADEFGKASDKFSESQKILETLKDSEYSEVSVTAIEICGILTQAQKICHISKLAADIWKKAVIIRQMQNSIMFLIIINPAKNTIQRN